MLYDLDCPNCGFLEDEIRAVDEREICPRCEGPCKVVLAPTMTVGIVFSNAEVSSQLGRTFETNKQKRDFLKEHPNMKPMEKGGVDDRAHRDMIQVKADRTAKKLGFDSMRQYKTELGKKNDMDKKQGLT
ncbi:MAG: hypothetical protein ACYTEQ_16960 [Planctomycetota bacterium]|jgi:hypothetical protein